MGYRFATILKLDEPVEDFLPRLAARTGLDVAQHLAQADRTIGRRACLPVVETHPSDATPMCLETLAHFEDFEVVSLAEAGAN
jgi:hypothetical protein